VGNYRIVCYHDGELAFIQTHAHTTHVSKIRVEKYYIIFHPAKNDMNIQALVNGFLKSVKKHFKKLLRDDCEKFRG
jgi:hypothetical protein